jgi:hypothetical protein
MQTKLNLYPITKSYELYSRSLNFDSKNDQIQAEYRHLSKECGRTAIFANFILLFDQSIKAMRKYIEMEDGRDSSTTMKGFFRLAGEKGLIDDFHKWMEFCKNRKLAKEPYMEETNHNVYETAKEFDEYAKKLITTLKERVE